MKLVNIFLRRETAVPIIVLGFASAVNVGVVIARIMLTHRIYYGFLVWNLFLAWIPLIFAVLASEQHRVDSKWNVRFAGLGLAWLLFFPNAPYICTDLIHLTRGLYMHFWVDMVLILMCAFTGLVIGFLSLYIMQAVVARMYGSVAGWLFIGAASALGSVGIFLGRFLRYNSWDIIVNPVGLYRDIGTWTANYGHNGGSIGFSVLFAAFLFIAYLILYALTHLSPSRMAALPASTRA